MRVLLDKVTTDIAVKKCGVNLSSICNCCIIHKEENAFHLFSESDMANKVWDFFCNSCGINFSKGLVRHRAMKWWLVKAKNDVHRTILQCIPTAICWHIWKSRCSARFDNIKMSGWFIIQQVIKFIKLVINLQFPDLRIPVDWHDVCKEVDQLKPMIVSVAVYWLKPDFGWVKLNVDGCSKGNPGSSGGGGIIRDHNGSVICAFAEYYGDCSNNLAEAKAMLRGIILCINSGFTNVIVESDSMIILNLIKRIKKPPWQLNHIIEQVMDLIKNDNFIFCHTLREGNNTADMLANLGEEAKNTFIFSGTVSIPSNIRASIKLETDGLPNFRFSKKKNKYVIHDSG
ncbi:uncharacterized protein LOC132639948 [Lycium barbarum]|uniref:uncharacterized protein LOC132639948 n=1 Tax=Lycium barbarum TaxID=112863 RepID=UPI00293EF2E4|nr:uncharacterized protein LOC132639948 [Lycium barbarum]